MTTHHIEKYHTKDGWIEHDGKGMPVPQTEIIEAMEKDGWTVTAAAWLQDWSNILSYRVVKP